MLVLILAIMYVYFFWDDINNNLKQLKKGPLRISKGRVRRSNRGKYI